MTTLPHGSQSHGAFLYARIKKHVFFFDLHHIVSRIALIIRLDKLVLN